MLTDGAKGVVPPAPASGLGAPFCRRRGRIGPRIGGRRRVCPRIGTGIGGPRIGVVASLVSGSTGIRIRCRHRYAMIGAGAGGHIVGIEGTRGHIAAAGRGGEEPTGPAGGL